MQQDNNNRDKENQQNAQTKMDETEMQQTPGKPSFDEIAEQAEEEVETRKPGSQSNSSKQHNNGRGGGK